MSWCRSESYSKLYSLLWRSTRHVTQCVDFHDVVCHVTWHVILVWRGVSCDVSCLATIMSCDIVCHTTQNVSWRIGSWRGMSRDVACHVTRHDAWRVMSRDAYRAVSCCVTRRRVLYAVASFRWCCRRPVHCPHSRLSLRGHCPVGSTRWEGIFLACSPSSHILSLPLPTSSPSPLRRAACLCCGIVHEVCANVPY